jgi:hypothetical protein
MGNRMNKMLNKNPVTLAEGDYKGYKVNFNLSFKAGGTHANAEAKARSETLNGVNVGNLFTKGSPKQFSNVMKSSVTQNPDGSTTTRTDGGVTINHNTIVMNSQLDTKMNETHEVFHTLFFDRDNAKSGIGGYPPQKVTQDDVNYLINTSPLPIIHK